MPLDTVAQIVRHFDGVKGDRSTFESLWQEVCDYGLARRAFQSNRDLPQGRGKRTRNIFDNTMMVANELWASAFHNLLTPVSTRWVHVEPEDEEVLDLPGVADWFAEVEDRLVEDIERYASGFHDQVSEVYADIGAFGNGPLATMYDGGLYFQALPLAETYLEEDAKGRVQRIYRDFQVTASQMIELFGDDAPKAAQEHYRAGKLGERHRVLQALLPNPAYAPQARYGPEAHSVESWYIDYKTKTEIRREHFREMPVAFGRLAKDSDELYARGHGVQAISDQRMNHKIKYTTLRGAEKAIDPPMLFPDTGFVTQVDLSAGGKTIYRASTPDMIRPLYDRGGQGVNLGIELVHHQQANIRAAYHYELLQMIQDPRMSATQVLEISGRLQQILAPQAARLQSSLLEPTVTRAFLLELRNGRFPRVPLVLARSGVRFRYVSPVQRAQRVSEARALLEALNATMQLAQFDARALDPIDTEQTVRFLFETYGVSPYLLRTHEELVALREERARLQEQEQARQEAAQVAESVGKAGPGIKAALDAFRGAA